MKNIKLLSALLFTVFIFNKSNAQSALAILNAESGNRAVEQGICWAFGSTSYSNTSGQVIAGSWSIRSNSMSNENLNSSGWIKSPWVKMTSGNITLKVKMESTSGTGGALGSGSYKAVRIRFIPYNASSPSVFKEGAYLADSFTYLIVSPFTNVQNISYAVPTSIASDNNVYKVMISFFGAGGNNRANIDDVNIPATYWANPSNNCLPQALIVDADNDGVQDSDDAYPNDAARAYNNVFPSSGYSTLMFEDLWPSLGDYDFNDFVADYKINRVTNAANKVVEIKAEPFCKSYTAASSLL